jgi:hypothetical protein
MNIIWMTQLSGNGQSAEEGDSFLVVHKDYVIISTAWLRKYPALFMTADEGKR